MRGKKSKQDYSIEYFETLGRSRDSLASTEPQRIRITHGLIPADWRSILDVGCGDGRVSNPLVQEGRRVVGIDYSPAQLERFKGEPIIANIAGKWPAIGTFDGAICAEVIEHLSPADGSKVISRIREHVRDGFIITVPARERLEEKTMRCASCGHTFHIWGHQRSFSSFEDVDRAVGQRSIARAFVPGLGRRPLLLLLKARQLLRMPLTAATVCMYCGAKVPPWPRVTGLRALALKGIRAVEILMSPVVPATGWFACRYGKKES